MIIIEINKINMEQSTILNNIEVNEILENFNIKNVSYFQLLIGGSENTNYLVKSEKRKKC